MVLNILSWNINGVKEKVSNEHILSFLKEMDVLVIIERQFNIRVKCPTGFSLVGRSSKIHSIAGNGIHGVAVFKNNNGDFQLDTVTVELIDSVIFRVRDSDVILTAMYIPPSNSHYFSVSYLILAAMYIPPSNSHYFSVSRANRQCNFSGKR